jgi:hypothetical protein
VEQAGEAPESQPAGTKPWLLPMVLWTAGLLLVLGLVWLVGAVVVPAYQAHEVFGHRALSYHGLRYVGPPGPHMGESALQALGGPERGAAKLDLYLRLPRIFTDQRGKAVRFLAACGKPAIPGLIRALSDPDSEVRLYAAQALGRWGPDAAAAIPALEKMLLDEDKSLRRAAEEALEKLTPHRGTR